MYFKTRYMNRRFLLILFCLFSFLLTVSVEVQAEKRKKKGKKENVEQKKESKYCIILLIQVTLDAQIHG